MLTDVLCPHFEDHTQSPEGYIQWHAWAETMSKTHEQIKCACCGFYAIWVPKPTPDRSEVLSVKENEGES